MQNYQRLTKSRILVEDINAYIEQAIKVRDGVTPSTREKVMPALDVAETKKYVDAEKTKQKEIEITAQRELFEDLTGLSPEELSFQEMREIVYGVEQEQTETERANELERKAKAKAEIVRKGLNKAFDTLSTVVNQLIETETDPFTGEKFTLTDAQKKLVKDFMRSGAAIDDNIGKLLDYLEKEKLADNTIVIYTADQGYFLGEHGFFDKRLMYEESSRMPFVIRYSKNIKGGQKIDDIILNIDFPALLADYAGIVKPDYMQGQSFRGILENNDTINSRKQMYYRYWLHQPERPGHFGIRNHRYKLIFFYGQDLDMKGASKEITPPMWEFYDLDKDPKELHNAINESQYDAIIKEMKKQLIEERKKYKDTDDLNVKMQDILLQNDLIN